MIFVFTQNIMFVNYYICNYHIYKFIEYIKFIIRLVPLLYVLNRSLIFSVVNFSEIRFPTWMS